MPGQTSHGFEYHIKHVVQWNAYCKPHFTLNHADAHSIGIYTSTFHRHVMARSRYWKITPDEIDDFAYAQQNLLNWEIKCVREPESEAHFIGVFMYRHGTAYDYESVRGISYFHNNISRKEVPEITAFLQGKFGGKEIEKGSRIILKGSAEIYSSRDIGRLAREMEDRFDAKAVISLEFEGLTAEQLKESGMPEAKLLPIPSK